MTDASGSPRGAWSFRHSGCIGGGWVTLLDLSDDGTLVVSNDIHNMYVYDPGGLNGRPFLRPGDNFPAKDWIRPVPGVGNWDICVAPTNSDVIYACINGEVWKTTDRGATITKTAFARNRALTYGNAYRMMGQRMRVDPAGADVVLLMDMAGLIYTEDGGAKWTRHSDIPSWTTPYAAICFDRGSAVVSRKTQEVFVAVPGQGVYRSTAGVTGSFSLIAGTPTHVTCLRHAGGKLHVCGDNGDGPYKTWTAVGGWVTPAGAPRGRTIAINPNNTDQVVTFMEPGGPSFISTDGGGTFKAHAGSLVDVADDAPWLANTAHNYQSIGTAVWDGSGGRNRLYIADGIGLWYINTPDVEGPPFVHVRHSITFPIKQLITQGMVCRPTDGRWFVTHQDRTVFAFPRDNPYVAHGHGVDPEVALVHGGSGIDHAIDNPAYIVCPHSNLSGASYSTDDGASWARFPSYPDAANGAMACGNQGNIVWVSSFNKKTYYTLDGGASWAEVLLGGQACRSHRSHFSSRLPLVADKQNPGTFYLFPHEPATMGVWKSTDGGTNWTQIHAGPITAVGDAYDGKLKMPWGRSPHMFWCSSKQNDYWDRASPGNFAFSNGGAHWQAIPGLDEVTDFAFGMPIAPDAYPAIYAAGFVRDAYGIYAMFDFNPAKASGNWRLLADYPLNSEAYYNVFAADMGLFGRFYAGGPCGQIVGNFEAAPGAT